MDQAKVLVEVKPDVVPGSQGNVLSAVKGGAQLADLVLDYPGAPATLWRLERDADKLQIGTTPLVVETSATQHVEAGGVGSAPARAYYQLKGLSPCSKTPGP